MKKKWTDAKQKRKKTLVRIIQHHRKAHFVFANRCAGMDEMQSGGERERERERGDNYYLIIMMAVFSYYIIQNMYLIIKILSFSFFACS